tara:strand:+ start:129 stop:1367 length:1239 start_codon:yes stop_codon:yes gene_type:complete
MALTKISTDGVKDDAVTAGKIPANAVGASELADNAVHTQKINDDAVTTDKLANSIVNDISANTAKTTNATHTGEVTGSTTLTIADDVVDEANLKVSNSPTNGYFLSAQSGNTGGLTWAAASGTTINNNADNRIITGSDTANTLEGESGLTFNGSSLVLNAATGNDARLTINGSEGQSARLSLISDEGDDHIDQYNLRVDASTNRFYIDQFESGSFVERFTIANGGYIGIGNSSPQRHLEILNWSGAGSTAGLELGDVGIRSSKTGSSTIAHLRFYNGNGQVGSIQTASSSTSYNTSSDYRLKENVVSISDGITRIKQLKPSKFNWIADETDTPVDGFLAHEVSSIVPESISGTKDAVATLKDVEDAIAEKVGDPIYQSIDQSKLVPLLTAALQEAIAKIEILETKVAALEAG